MQYWTEQNSDGFTLVDLQALNFAQSELQRMYPRADASSIADRLNNAWQPNATAIELIKMADFK